MIILTEVAKKLNAILNNRDDETSDITNPTDFEFVIETEGFHIDNIINRQEGRNYIPVFISSMGGQFNPVKGLKQATYTINISFFYPVRFKDDFYALGEFLAEVFVGSILNYGTVSGKAVSNISVPQYGELQNLDLKQFREWANDIYGEIIEDMGVYMSMNVGLYLSNAAPGLIYGNDIKTTFSFTYKNNEYSIDNIQLDDASIQSNSQAQSEQEEGTNEANSLPFGTNYGASFKIYPNLELEANESTTQTPVYFYKELLKAWFSGDVQEIQSEISFKIANDDNLIYKRKCFIQSIVAPIQIGQLLTLTLSFAKVADPEDEDTEE